MKVQAQRFKVLSEETNLPISDFLSETGLDPLNNLVPNIDEMKAAFQEQLDIGKSELLEFIPEEISSLLPEEDTTRKVKDIFSGLKDISKITPTGINKAIEDLIPDPTARSLYNKIAAKCRTSPLKTPTIGKPFNPSLNCNNRTKNAGAGGCNSGSMSNFFDKLTGGALPSVYKDLNNMLKQIVAFSGLGYKFNLCGAFNAMASTFGGDEKDLIRRGSAAVLGNLAGLKNLSGILDLSTSEVGRNLNTKLELPNASKKVFEGFSIPSEYKVTELGGLFSASLAAAGAFDTGWNVSESGSSTIANLVEANPGEDFDKTVKGYFDSHVPSSSDLDMIPNDDDYFVGIASQSNHFSGAFG